MAAGDEYNARGDMVLKVRRSDDVIKDLLDKVGSCIRSIDYMHSEIHGGGAYQVSRVDAGVADDGQICYKLTPGTKYIHLKEVSVGASGGNVVELQIDLLEDPTFSTAGTTAATPTNKNRGSSNTSDLAVITDSVISADGTNLGTFLTAGQRGGSFNLSDETVLDPAKVYSVRVTNLSGAARDISLALLWYEESGNG